MRQLLVIARYDLRRHWREGGVQLITVALTLLVGAAALHGAVRVAQARDEAARLITRIAESESEIARLARTAPPAANGVLAWDARNPDFVANDRGTLAIATPPPLLQLSVGQTALYPTEVKVTAAGQDSATTAVEIAPPLSLAMGTFDLEFVLVFLWPLAILAVTADLTAGDRERGVLRMLLAQPTRARAALAGPLLARGGIVLAPAIVVPWLAMPVSPTPSFVQTALWTVAALAYGMFWMGLSAWVAAQGRSAVMNATSLAGLWLILTMIVPGAVNLAMTTWSVVPSSVVFADAVRAATRDALSDGSRVLGHFLEDHPTASAVGRDGLRQYALLQAARDQEVARRLAPLVRQYEAALARQRRIAAVARFLSPAMLVSDAFQQAAGSSRERARHFARQVDAFREEWRAFFQPRILDGARLTLPDAASLPRFAYSEEPWTAAARRLLPGVGAMAVSGAALLLVGLRRFARSPLGSPAS